MVEVTAPDPGPIAPVQPPARGRSSRRVVTIIAVVVGIAILAAAGAGVFLFGPFSKTALALGFQPGQSYRYHLHEVIDFAAPGSGGSAKGDLKGTATLTVKSVDKDGVATIEMKLDEIDGTSNGKPVPESAKQPRTIELRISRDGRFLPKDQAGDASSSGGASSGLDQFSPVLPDEAVKPGDTWSKTVEQPNPFGAGTIKAVTNNKFLRRERVGGADTAVINTTGSSNLDLTLNFGDLLSRLGQSGGSGDPRVAALLQNITAHVLGPISFDRTAWIDPAKKELVRTKAVVNEDVKITTTGGPEGIPTDTAMKGTVTVEMERF